MNVPFTLPGETETKYKPDPICECSHRKSEHPREVCRAHFTDQHNRLCGCVRFWERAFPRSAEAHRG